MNLLGISWAVGQKNEVFPLQQPKGKKQIKNKK
jgi:hypothetical protein